MSETETETKPEDMLRKASRRLLTLVGHVRSSNWRLDSNGCCIVADDQVEDGTVWVISERAAMPDAVAYIAHMNPKVGIALANLLDIEADYWRTPISPRNRAALNLARTIMGEEEK